MRVLITGITGFVGHYLSELFIKDGHEVFGTTFSSKDLISEKLKIFKCMRVLITGITGFVGHYLSELFIKDGHEVFGTTFSSKDLISEKLKIFKCDIRDAAKVKEILSDIKPQQIYHLSAISSPLNSIKNPRTTLDINFYGTMNLIEALRETGLDSHILFVGSVD